MNEFFRIHRDPDARQKKLQLHRIESQSDLDLWWLTGERFLEPPTSPIQTVLAAAPAKDFPDVFLSDQIPLFSARFVECLRGAGVDNLDCYDAAVVDAKGKPVPVPYVAVNIVGRVACVDHRTSRKRPLSAYPMTDFEYLAIDPVAAGGCRLFRLADNASYIIASREVQEAMDKADLVDVKALSLYDRYAY
jgi:hypothetical protein